MRLEGKVALITGAASGLGKEACHLFASEGAKVIAVDLNEPACQEVAGEIEKNGGQAIAVKADVSTTEDTVAMFEKGVGHFGKLDVLYNNAGVFWLDKDFGVVDTPEQVWDDVIRINLRSIYLGCKYGIPYILKNGGGSVINKSSFVSYVGSKWPQDAYTVSKGAVIPLTRSLAIQYAPDQVRVNALCPGPIETPLLGDILHDEEKKKERAQVIPMKRFGKPRDIANAALFLASDESSFITGIELIVDGGIIIS